MIIFLMVERLVMESWAQCILTRLTSFASAVDRGHYVNIHTSNFQDLMLKPELLRAVVDCGFEHPSEGKSKQHSFDAREDERETPKTPVGMSVVAFSPKRPLKQFSGMI
jgi:hypothetical protein